MKQICRGAMGAIACSAVAALALSTAASAAETWDLPTAYPASNFQTVNAGEFGSCVAKGTSGEINIVVHPNGSLFKGNDIKRAVQTGQVQIGERLLSSHENENPVFGTDSIPFVATNYADSVRLYQAARPDLEKVLADQGLKLVYSVPWPAQGLFFKKDVNDIADMSGIKVRSYNKSTAKVANATGMTPVSIEAAEISQGLAAGVINSLITSAVTGSDSKVWEQLDHFYEVGAWMPRNYVIMNLNVWTGLSKEKQAAVQACATAAEASGLEKSKAAEADAIAALQKNGVHVLAPSDSLKAELNKVGSAIASDWAKGAGDMGSGILARYAAK